MLRMASLMILPALAIAGDPTSGTLRLEDLFRDSSAAPKHESAPPSPPPSTASRRLLVELPNLERWRATPTPAPTASPTSPDLPAVPSLSFDGSGEVRLSDRTFLDERGVAPGDDAKGLGEVILTTRTDAAIARYEIVLRGDEVTTGTVVTLHPSGMAERFLLPAGEYEISRQLWFAQNPSARATTLFPAQALVAGIRYEGGADPAAEREARVRIDLARTRAR